MEDRPSRAVAWGAGDTEQPDCADPLGVHPEHTGAVVIKRFCLFACGLIWFTVLIPSRVQFRDVKSIHTGV